MELQTLNGNLSVFFLFDVAEEISLDALVSLTGTSRVSRSPEFHRPAPDYVRFAEAPFVEPIEGGAIASSGQWAGRIKYYDYGVVGVELQQQFQGTWEALLRFVARWLNSDELERYATEIVRSRIAALGPALSKPYQSWLSEDYSVFVMEPFSAGENTPVTASQLLEERGGEIAQIVRGEPVPLSPSERREILQGSISYYPRDLLVVGWTTAFLYDTAEGAAPVVQLLEYANSQLLVFRHYDEILTRVLRDAYRWLDEKQGPIQRWRLVRRAEQLNTLRLDITEITERADHSIKFLSDMFYARVYRLASNRIGVPDYRDLVEEKLRTAGDLYRFMVDQFNHARSFLMELMIVIILIIDLFFLFREAFFR